jgi:hypothetical protein
MNKSTKYWTAQLRQVCGGVVERPIVTPPDEDGVEFFGLQIRLPHGESRVLWILGDEEGNMPGAVEIEKNFKVKGIEPT